MSQNHPLFDISSIIEQVKIRPNLERIDIGICPRLRDEKKITLKNTMKLPRKLICNLLVLRSAQEMRRLASNSAMKRFPKDLTRMLSNFF